MENDTNDKKDGNTLNIGPFSINMAINRASFINLFRPNYYHNAYTAIAVLVILLTFSNWILFLLLSNGSKLKVVDWDDEIIFAIVEHFLPFFAPLLPFMLYVIISSSRNNLERILIALYFLAAYLKAFETFLLIISISLGSQFFVYSNILLMATICLWLWYIWRERSPWKEKALADKLRDDDDPARPFTSQEKRDLVVMFLFIITAIAIISVIFE